MTRGSHQSDDPGHLKAHGEDIERHPSSGPSAASPPRRPGTGERQAPREHYAGATPEAERAMVPGEVLYGDDPVVINAGADVITVRVANTADRPVQVGSHYHFAEVNAGLDFDREAAWGRRLNVLSGGSVRFEPGAVQQVELIPIRGARVVPGLRGLCGGPLDG
jgi:urease subunit beta